MKKVLFLCSLLCFALMASCAKPLSEKSEKKYLSQNTEGTVTEDVVEDVTTDESNGANDVLDDMEVDYDESNGADDLLDDMEVEPVDYVIEFNDKVFALKEEYEAKLNELDAKYETLFKEALGEELVGKLTEIETTTEELHDLVKALKDNDEYQAIAHELKHLTKKIEFASDEEKVELQAQYDELVATLSEETQNQLEELLSKKANLKSLVNDVVVAFEDEELVANVEALEESYEEEYEALANEYCEAMKALFEEYKDVLFEGSHKGHHGNHDKDFDDVECEGNKHHQGNNEQKPDCEEKPECEENNHNHKDDKEPSKGHHGECEGQGKGHNR